MRTAFLVIALPGKSSDGRAGNADGWLGLPALCWGRPSKTVQRPQLASPRSYAGHGPRAGGQGDEIQITGKVRGPRAAEE